VKKFRFLHFTDLHLSSRQPRNRKDDYPEAILAKLEFLAESAAQDCNAVFFTGDFFDTTDEPQPLIESAKKIIEKSEIPWFFIPGQHELIAYNVDTLEWTSLGHLTARCSHCQEPKYPTVAENSILTPTTPTPLSDFQYKCLGGATEITIAGLPAGAAKRLYETEDWKKLNATILLLHEMVTPKTVPWEHMLASEIVAPPGVRLILCGDYHGSFSAKTKKDESGQSVPVVNPGAVARKSISEAKRAPKAWKFSITNSGRLSDFTSIKIPHLPAEQAFKLDEVRKQAEAEIDLSAFEESVEALASVVSDASPEKVLHTIVESEEFHQEEKQSILEIAKEYLNRALGSGE